MRFVKKIARELLPEPVFLFFWFHYHLNASNSLKIQTIKRLQKKLNLNIFIETGTNYGMTLYGVKNSFQKLYSIEMDKALFDEAKKKFSFWRNICILNGDSGRLLLELLVSIKEPAFFWLDAHASEAEKKAPPILNELKAIEQHFIKNHVILIDDARLFNGKNNWPDIQEIISTLRRINQDFEIKIENDILMAVPKQ